MSTLASVTEQSFETDVLNRKGLTLVDFWASWCAPCRQLAPTLEQIQAEKGDALKIVKLNIEEYPEIAAQFRIQNIPFMMLFKDGKQVDQMVGNRPKRDILSWIENHG